MMAPNKPPTTLAVNKKRTEISLEGIREKGGAEVCLGLKAEAGGLFSAGICPLADIDAGFTLPEGCRAAAWWQTDGLSAVYAEVIFTSAARAPLKRRRHILTRRPPAFGPSRRRQSCCFRTAKRRSL